MNKFIIIFIFFIIILLILVIKKRIKYQRENKPIIFYHPMIKTKYCKLIMKGRNDIDILDIINKLIEENNYMMRYHCYNDMNDRLKFLLKNKKIITIFNMLEKINIEEKKIDI
jgi:hypothetical protein